MATTLLDRALSLYNRKQRIILTADLDLYVRADGNDANTGFSDDVTAAFLTIQRAIDFLSCTYDTSNFSIYIHVGPGTFAPFTFKDPLGNGKVYVTGSGSESTIIDGTNNSSMRHMYGSKKIIMSQLKINTNNVGMSVFIPNRNSDMEIYDETAPLPSET